MDAFNMEELSALINETLSTDISDPRRDVDFQEVPAKIVAYCSILGIHLPFQNPFNSNSQPMPYDRNRNTEIDRLPSDVMQNVLSYLPNHDVRRVEQVSRSWYLAVRSLQKHHNAMVQNKYALEASYFGCREVNGRLVPCRETALRVIKFAPIEPCSYRGETPYADFLASYRAEYQRLCSVVLTFVKGARPGLNLDRDALYCTLLVWNTWQWRGHREYPIPVIPNQGDDGPPRSVILDFFPKSLLTYLVRGRKLFCYSKCERDVREDDTQAFQW